MDAQLAAVSSSLRSVHLLHHLVLGELLLLGVVVLAGASRDSVVHQSLNRLLALGRVWLQLVEWVVQHLSVVGKELAELV